MSNGQGTNSAQQGTTNLLGNHLLDHCDFTMFDTMAKQVANGGKNLDPRQGVLALCGRAMGAEIVLGRLLKNRHSGALPPAFEGRDVERNSAEAPPTAGGQQLFPHGRCLCLVVVPDSMDNEKHLDVLRDDLAFAGGFKATVLPNKPQDRAKLYGEGGVMIVRGKQLVADLLHGRLSPALVSTTCMFLKYSKLGSGLYAQSNGGHSINESVLSFAWEIMLNGLGVATGGNDVIGMSVKKSDGGGRAAATGSSAGIDVGAPPGARLFVFSDAPTELAAGFSATVNGPQQQPAAAIHFAKDKLPALISALHIGDIQVLPRNAYTTMKYLDSLGPRHTPMFITTKQDESIKKLRKLLLNILREIVTELRSTAQRLLAEASQAAQSLPSISGSIVGGTTGSGTSSQRKTGGGGAEAILTMLANLTVEQAILGSTQGLDRRLTAFVRSYYRARSNIVNLVNSMFSVRKLLNAVGEVSAGRFLIMLEHAMQGRGNRHPLSEKFLEGGLNTHKDYGTTYRSGGGGRARGTDGMSAEDAEERPLWTMSEHVGPLLSVAQSRVFEVVSVEALDEESPKRPTGRGYGDGLALKTVLRPAFNDSAINPRLWELRDQVRGAAWRMMLQCHRSQKRRRDGDGKQLQPATIVIGVSEAFYGTMRSVAMAIFYDTKDQLIQNHFNTFLIQYHNSFRGRSFHAEGDPALAGASSNDNDDVNALQGGGTAGALLDGLAPDGLPSAKDDPFALLLDLELTLTNAAGDSMDGDDATLAQQYTVGKNNKLVKSERGHHDDLPQRPGDNDNQQGAADEVGDGTIGGVRIKTEQQLRPAAFPQLHDLLMSTQGFGSTANKDKKNDDHPAAPPPSSKPPQGGTSSIDVIDVDEESDLDDDDVVITTSTTDSGRAHRILDDPNNLDWTPEQLDKHLQVDVDAQAPEFVRLFVSLRGDGECADVADGTERHAAGEALKVPVLIVRQDILSPMQLASCAAVVNRSQQKTEAEDAAQGMARAPTAAEVTLQSRKNSSSGGNKKKVSKKQQPGNDTATSASITEASSAVSQPAGHYFLYSAGLESMRSIECFAALMGPPQAPTTEGAEAAAQQPLPFLLQHPIVIRVDGDDAQWDEIRLTVDAENKAFFSVWVHAKTTLSSELMVDRVTKSRAELELSHFASRSAAGGRRGYLQNSENAILQRKQGNAMAEGMHLDASLISRPLVIFDERELRSTLAYHLYTLGVDVVPMVLLRGDYILSPSMAIERKAIDDLVKSTIGKKSRLPKQIENMTNSFKHVVILVEFERTQKFELQAHAGFGERYNILLQKLFKLIANYPTLRFIWSRSPKHAAKMISNLKKNVASANPDVDAVATENTASLATFSGSTTTTANAPNGGGSAGGPDDGIIRKPTESARLAQRMLMRFPGVKESNAQRIMDAAGSLRNLPNLSKDELIAAAVGPNGKPEDGQHGETLFNFLHEPLAESL